MHSGFLLACQRMQANGEMRRLVDCVCTYVCGAGLLLLFFFLQSFQMAILSVQMRVILGFFTAWLHIMLSVLTSFI